MRPYPLYRVAIVTRTCKITGRESLDNRCFGSSLLHGLPKIDSRIENVGSAHIDRSRIQQARQFIADSSWAVNWGDCWQRRQCWASRFVGRFAGFFHHREHREHREIFPSTAEAAAAIELSRPNRLGWQYARDLPFGEHYTVQCHSPSQVTTWLTDSMNALGVCGRASQGSPLRFSTGMSVGIGRLTQMNGDLPFG